MNSTNKIKWGPNSLLLLYVLEKNSFLYYSDN